jgi:hypothetical protein
VILEWTNHLSTEEEKKRFEREVYSARPVLERLSAILDKKERALDRSEQTLKAYSEPNWGERQAHKNGIRQDLAETKALLDLDRRILMPGD